MIKAAISFFILALIAYALGANNLMGLSMDIGKTFVIVFAVLSALSILSSLLSGRRIKRYDHIN